MATIAYTAPEGIDGPSTTATDVWSFGIMLNQMVTGKVSRYRRLIPGESVWGPRDEAHTYRYRYAMIRWPMEPCASSNTRLGRSLPGEITAELFSLFPISIVLPPSLCLPGAPILWVALGRHFGWAVKRNAASRVADRNGRPAAADGRGMCGP